MSGGAAIAVTLAAVAGLAGSVQIAIMGRLGQRIGTLEALGFATALSLVLVVALLLVFRQSLSGLVEETRAPAWMWLGAVMGTFIVFTITYTPAPGSGSPRRSGS